MFTRFMNTCDDEESKIRTRHNSRGPNGPFKVIRGKYLAREQSLLSLGLEATCEGLRQSTDKIYCNRKGDDGRTAYRGLVELKLTWLNAFRV